MPYESKAQQRLFHAKEERGEISPAKVHEWDAATKKQPGGFAALPERAKKKKKAELVFSSAYDKAYLRTLIEKLVG